MNDGSNAHFLSLQVPLSLPPTQSFPHASHRLPQTAVSPARAAQRWAIQRLLQPRQPDFNKARVPAAAARIVGIFLCLPFPSRSPSSSGLDNIPGTSGEGVQEQTPSCGVFYERLAMVGRSLQNNSMHICRETGSFFRKSEGAERPPHAVS